MKKIILFLLIIFNSAAALEDCDFNPTNKVTLIQLCESIEIDKLDQPVSPISKTSNENIWSSKDFRFFMGTAGAFMIYGAVIGGWIGSHWYPHCE